jgi:hypothetical protein
MTTIHELYEHQVKPLPVTERLQLARLIMDELADSANNWIVDTSDTWSEQDTVDVQQASMRYAAQLHEDEEEDAESW